MYRGWIRTYRKIVDNPWFTDPLTSHFWEYCRIKASHKPTTVQVRGTVINLDRGQFVFGRNKASEETGIPPQSIRTCLLHLKSTNQITITSTKRFSIVTVCNYDIYNPTQDDINQQINQEINHQPTINQPSTNHVQEQEELKEQREDNTPLTPQGESETFALVQELITEPADDPASAEAEFTEFYAAYPRKKNRADALKAFSKAIGQVPGSKIIERALAYASSVYVTSRLGTDDERYIPHPATWLRAESFNDDPRNWNIPRKVNTNGQSNVRTGPGQVFDPTIAHSTQPIRVPDRWKRREADKLNEGTLAANDGAIANAGRNTTA